MDDLLVESPLNDLEDLVLKLCGDLDHSECCLIDVKDSDFGSSSDQNLLTYKDSRTIRPLFVDEIMTRLLN